MCDVYMSFPGGSDRKESAKMQDTWVQSLGQEDPLEKGMAISYIIFIHLSNSGHLDCLHVLAIVSSTAITWDCSYFSSFFLDEFLDEYPKVELLDHMVVLFLTFL